MRILLLTGGMENGGAETHVYDLAVALTQRGHKITLVSSGGRYADELESKGIECVRLPTCKKTPWALFALRRGLGRLLSNERFDAVHSHTRITSAVASAVCRKKRVPLVTTAHALFRTNRILERISRWGDATVAVSQDIGQRLLRSGNVAYENITVIPNGVNTAKLVPSEKPMKNKVCFLSRLDADCSSVAFALCRIAPKLASLIADVEIYIGGDGEKHQRVRWLADRVNAEIGREVIRTVGRVTDIAEFLSGATVFTGVSRAAMEAMSCGVPTVLAGDEGYLGVVDGEALARAEATNFCCRGEPRVDDERLARDILRLLSSDCDQIKALSEKSREYIIKHHSADEMARQTEAVYQKVVRRCDRLDGGVLLCGYYGFGNMGDDALLHAAVDRAKREYPNAPVCALTKSGRRDERQFGVRCVCRYSPVAVKREIRSAHVVVFGGGTLLQNGTSRRSLLYYVRLLSLAEKTNTPTELWGNGIGNVSGKYSRRMTAMALAGCRYVGLRDRESVAEAAKLFKEFGYSAPSVASEDDLASNTLPCGDGRLSYILSELDVTDRPIAVIAIRGVEKAGFKRIMEKHVTVLASEGITPVYLPMFPSEDLEACRRVCRERGGVVAYPLGVPDAVALIRYATVVLSMRYHAMVFAASVGTPFVGYGAEPKLERFCRSHGGKYFTDILQ